jgi:hypothetical protein
MDVIGTDIIVNAAVSQKQTGNFGKTKYPGIGQEIDETSKSLEEPVGSPL